MERFEAILLAYRVTEIDGEIYAICVGKWKSQTR